jgi:hypothetical protein
MHGGLIYFFAAHIVLVLVAIVFLLFALVAVIRWLASAVEDRPALALGRGLLLYLGGVGLLAVVLAVSWGIFLSSSGPNYSLHEEIHALEVGGIVMAIGSLVVAVGVAVLAVVRLLSGRRDRER